jgi:CBS domain-containing protein
MLLAIKSGEAEFSESSLGVVLGDAACYHAAIGCGSPMETVLAILQLLIPISLCIAGVLCFAGIAGGGGKSELEDQAQYEHFNPHVKPVREVHRKEPTPLQTKDSAVTVDKKPEKVVVPDDLGKTKLVHGLMEKQAYYCFENQSVDEALRIMREHGLQYLPVVDSNLRVVGMVRRHY